MSFFLRPLLALTLLLALAPGVGADRVELATEKGAGVIEVEGKVIDFTGEKITLERLSGMQKSYRASRVRRVDTDWPDGYLAGQAALQKRDYAEAIRQLTAATRKEQRPWVRRLAMTSLMQAYVARGDWSTGGDLLVAIAGSDPTTAALDQAPLAWFPISGVPRGKVEQWLADARSPTARLLGASHAMQTNRRNDALRELQKLQQSGDPRIAFLAQSQAWRASVVSAKQAEIDRWKKRTLQSPERLQAGAWLVIGDGYRQQRQYDDALLAYLRLPTLHAEQPQLAAEGLLKAAQTAQAAGQHDEVAKLAAELLRDYAETPPAKQARAMLQSAGSPSAAPAGN